MNRFQKTASALALAALLPLSAVAEDKISVVTSFTILQDMVENVGGDKVSVTTLVGRNGDAHVYQPTPAAARAVKEAHVMVVNGLAFEGWLDRLSEAAGFEGTLVVATDGIEPIGFEDPHGHHDDHDDHDDDEHHDEDKHHDDDEHHDEDKHHDDDDHHDEHKHHDDDDHHDEDKHHDDDEHHDEDKHHDDDDHHDEDKHHDDDDEHHAEGGHHDHHDHGEFDPHAWLSPTLAVTYVDNITAALAKAAPEHAGTFYQNRATYVAEIEAVKAEMAAMLADLPEDQRTVVTSHDAFGYFGRDFDLSFLAPQGYSTESEASAKDVAELIEHMREDGVKAVFMENITDSRLLEQIANETGATIGGTLYPGALSEEDGPAATYIELLRHNASTLASALK
ncbi:MAG: zinc ABC transporter substrate-binding protein [Pseudomonadota bacterium]